MKKWESFPGAPPLDAIPGIRDALIVEGSCSLDLGGDIFLDLTKVEGHSPGNLLGLVKNDRTLLCSDSLGFHYPGRGFWPLFFTGAAAYVATIDLITCLAPRVIGPAHQGHLKATAVAQDIKDARDITLSTIERVKHTPLSDTELTRLMFKESYRDEFTLYTRENILNCTHLLIKRAREEKRLP